MVSNSLKQAIGGVPEERWRQAPPASGRLNLIVYTVLAALTFAAAAALVWVRSELYIFGSYDSAFYLEALSRLARLEAPTSTFLEFFSGVTPRNVVFGHHFQYSAVIFVPFFWLGLSPTTVGFYLVPAFTLALIVFWWWRLYPKRTELIGASAGLLLVFWAPCSGLIHSHDFYLDKFVIPWACAALYYYRKEEGGKLFAALVLVAGFKEYFALFASLACFLFFYRTRRTSALLWGAGFLIYCAVIPLLVMPWFLQGDSLLHEHFGAHEGASSLWERIPFLLENALNPRAVSYLAAVLGQFLFLPLLYPELSLMSLPVLAVNVLSGAENALIKPYYSTLPTTVLSVAFMAALQRLRGCFKSFLSPRKVSALLGVLAVAALPYGSVHYHLYRVKADLATLLSDPEYVEEIDRALASIEEGEVLSVAPRLAPYLFHHRAYIFPKPFQDPEMAREVDRIVVSRHHASYLENFNGSEERFRAALSEIAAQYDFDFACRSKSLRVLERKPETGEQRRSVDSLSK